MIGDFEQLKHDVEGIIKYSQDYPFDVDCSALMEKWEEAKIEFIRFFGGKLVVRSEKPIKVKLSEDQQSRKFNDFISTLDDNGVLTPEFEDFLRNNKEGFFINRVIEAYPAKNIRPGTKLLRSFRNFINGNTTTRWAQDTASCYIQENSVEGYLYLSVDPRDFLTLSENNCRWTSCHSLDGEFRAGNMSYITDNVTMVAYLASDKQEHLKCLPKGMTWNSKKWRMLVHKKGSSCIYFNRQYPFTSDVLLDETCNMIKNLYNEWFSDPLVIGFKSIPLQNGNIVPLSCNHIVYGDKIYSAQDVVDYSEYLGYRDIVFSSLYLPTVSIGGGCCSPKDRINIKIGGESPCVVCGEGTMHRDTSFLCDECIAVLDADEDFFLTCDMCYHRLYDEDEIFWRDGKPYCKACYQEMLKDEELEEEYEEDDCYG